MPLRNRTYLIDYSCFFITTTCNQWLNLIANEECISLMYESLKFLNKKYTTQIIGYVFMPNHIHLIFFFPKENKMSDYMRDFKKFTSTHIRKIIERNDSELLEKLRFENRKQKFKVWMDRFDDVVIRSTKILMIKLNYIHYNPVNKGLVNRPEDYKHSSAGFYFRNEMPLIPILHARSYGKR